MHQLGMGAAEVVAGEEVTAGEAVPVAGEAVAGEAVAGEAVGEAAVAGAVAGEALAGSGPSVQMKPSPSDSGGADGADGGCGIKLPRSRLKGFKCPSSLRGGTASCVNVRKACGIELISHTSSSSPLGHRRSSGGVSASCGHAVPRPQHGGSRTKSRSPPKSVRTNWMNCGSLDSTQASFATPP